MLHFIDNNDKIFGRYDKCYTDIVTIIVLGHYQELSSVM